MRRLMLALAMLSMLAASPTGTEQDVRVEALSCPRTSSDDCQPLAGAAVRVHDDERQAVAAVSTDRNGTAIVSLPPGNYALVPVLSTSHPGQPPLRDRIPFTVGRDGHDAIVPVRYAPLPG